jgi:c-di-GMP-binding flagellar brake protein YcgR
MDNKRKFKRVSVNAIVMYMMDTQENNHEDLASSIGTPNSVDISTGGLKIIAGQKLPIGANLKVILSILPSKIPIEVICKVVWTKNADVENLYQSGIEFLKFSDKKQKELIESYVDTKE